MYQNRLLLQIAIAIILFFNSLLPAQEVELVVQQGHSSSVYTVSFSPDGKIIASGSSDNTVKLWETGSGSLLRTLKGHSNSVSAVSFSPDGKIIASGSGERITIGSGVRIATGSSDNTVKLWEASSGKLLRTLEGHSSDVFAVSFSPDGKIIASGSEDNTVKLWESGSGKLLRTLEDHSLSVSAVSFSPDGKIIASGSEDNTVKLWESDSGKLLCTLEDHSLSVYAVSFSPDGKIIASGSEDNTVKLWEVANGKLLRTLEGHSNYVEAVSFSPDGKIIASGSWDKTIKFWEAANGKLLRTLEGYSDYVEAVSFSPDGNIIASGSRDNNVKLWESGSGNLLRTLEGHSYSVYTVSFSPDGKIIASGNEDNTVKLWESGSGNLLRTLRGHSDYVSAVSFSPDGKFIASGSVDNTVKLWEAFSGNLLRTMEDDSYSVYTVSFSPDGKIIASGNGDKTVKLWDVSSGNLIRTLKGHSFDVSEVSFSPDGNIIASGSRDKTVKLWESGSGKLLRTLEGHFAFVTAVSFSPHGKIIASGSWDNAVKLWEASSGNLLRTLRGHSYFIEAVSFSPDGKIVASGSWDNAVKLWEVSSGNLLRTLEGHSSDVYAVSFNPDGKIVASGSGDNTIKLWESSSGKLLLTLVHFAKGWVAYTPGGQYAASDEALVRFTSGLTSYSAAEYRQRFGGPKPGLVVGLGINQPAVKPISSNTTPLFNSSTLAESIPSLVLEIQPTRIKIGESATLSWDTQNCERVELKNEEKWETVALGDIRKVFPSADTVYEVRAFAKQQVLHKEVAIIVEGAKAEAVISKATPRKQTRYALVVGIEKYARGFQPLTYAVDDATAVYNFLIKEAGYKPEHVKLLLNEQATNNAISDELARIHTEFNSEECSIFIYFSGHGINVLNPETGKSGYLLTTDTQNSISSIRSRGLPIDKLRTLQNNVYAERLLIILDTCFSGGGDKVKAVRNPELKPGETEKDGNIYSIYDNLGQVGKGRIFISACRSNETAIESDELGQSVFTFYLLEALQKKKLRKLQDVYEYTRQQVTAKTNLMHPVLNISEQEGEVYIF